MGLIAKIGEMRMKDPVEGTLNVVGISMPDPTATSANYRIDGVVSAADLPATPVVHHGMASLKKWPSPGDTLPVTVDRSKPERLVIHWDQITTGRAAAQSAAAQLAEQMRSGGVGATDREALLQQALALRASMQSAASFVPPVTQEAAKVVSAADILARGNPGLASIESVFPTMQTTQKPNHTVLGLVLNVMVAGQPTSVMRNLYAVPNEKLAAVVVGTTLPIKVDPDSPDLVAVDWAAVAA